MSREYIYLECYNEIKNTFKEIRGFVKLSKPHLKKVKDDREVSTSFRKGISPTINKKNVVRNSYPRLIHNILGSGGYINAIDEIIKNVNLLIIESAGDSGYDELLTSYTDLNILTNNNKNIKSIFSLTDEEIKANVDVLMSGRNKQDFINNIEAIKKYFYKFCGYITNNFLSKKQKEELSDQLNTIHSDAFRNIYNKSNTTKNISTNQTSYQPTVQDTVQDTVQKTIPLTTNSKETSQLEVLNDVEINLYYESIKSLLILSNDLCKRYLKSSNPGELSFSQDPTQFIRFYDDIENVLNDKVRVENVKQEFDFIIDIFTELIAGLKAINENNVRRGILIPESISLDLKFQNEIDYILNASKKENVDIQSLESLYESFDNISPQSMKAICLKFKENFDLNRTISYLENSVRTLKEYKNMFNVR